MLYVSNASAIASGDFFCGGNEATDTITVYISKDERRGWKSNNVRVILVWSKKKKKKNDEEGPFRGLRSLVYHLGRGTWSSSGSFSSYGLSTVQTKGQKYSNTKRLEALSALAYDSASSRSGEQRRKASLPSESISRDGQQGFMWVETRSNTLHSLWRVT